MLLLNHMNSIARKSGYSFRHIPTSRILRKLHTPMVKEITIPSTYGSIAAKWWGDEARQPLLAVHGWQDNAGSWDRLIPLLPPNCSVLAIDLNGHGHSEWLPKRATYENWMYVQTIKDIIQHFKWDKVSFLCHSLGSIMSFLYSTLYPETVKYHIAIENIVPDINVASYERCYKYLRANLEGIKLEEDRLNTEAPGYPYEEAIIRWHMGTQKSVSLESAHCLVDRGTRQSSTDPKKYYFCRDPRLKYKLLSLPEPEYVKYGVRMLQHPIMYVKGKDSDYATDVLSVECRELLAQTNSKFEIHWLPGTHHVHLNTPELVAPLITQFIEKYGLPSA